MMDMIPQDPTIAGAGAGGIIAGLTALYHKWANDRKLEKMAESFDALEKHLDRSLAVISQKQASDTIYAVKTFATKDDVSSIREDIRTAMGRIDDKLEKLHSRIDEFHKGGR
jgi:gas vesicle protein